MAHPTEQKGHPTVSGISELLPTLYPEFRHNCKTFTEVDGEKCPFFLDDQLSKSIQRVAHMLIVSSPVLSYPDYSKRFFLDTDASDTGIGAGQR